MNAHTISGKNVGQLQL